MTFMRKHRDRARHPAELPGGSFVSSVPPTVGRHKQPFTLQLLPDLPGVIVAEILADRDRDGFGFTRTRTEDAPPKYRRVGASAWCRRCVASTVAWRGVCG